MLKAEGVIVNRGKSRIIAARAADEKALDYFASLNIHLIEKGGEFRRSVAVTGLALRRMTRKGGLQTGALPPI